MVKHVNERDGEIREMFTGASMLLTVNDHNMQLERALDECRREYNILIYCNPCPNTESIKRRAKLTSPMHSAYPSH
jgi:hypothetical protein